MSQEIVQVVDHDACQSRSHENGLDTSRTQGSRGVLAGLASPWRRKPGPSLITDPLLAGQMLHDEVRWAAPREPRDDVRELLAPVFAVDALEGYLEAATPILEETVEGWIADGQVAFKRATRHLFARVSAKVLAGVDDPAEVARLDRSMRALGAGCIAGSQDKPRHLSSWRARRAYRVLFERFKIEVGRRRDSTGPDLLGRLCQVREQGVLPDDDTLVRTFLAVMGAVYNTSAASVTSMAYLLATHWKWQERLQTEAICATTGRPHHGDLEKLIRHDLVWCETLRLFPIFPTTERVARRDIDLGGERIAAGTIVQVALSAAFRDPSYWTSPEVFDPERFRAMGGESAQAPDPCRLAMLEVHPNLGAPVTSFTAKAFWHALGSRARFRLAAPYSARHEFRPLGVVSGPVDLTLEPLVPR